MDVPLQCTFWCLLHVSLFFWAFFIWDSMLLSIFNGLSVLLVFLCICPSFNPSVFVSFSVVVVSIYMYQDSSCCVVFTCRLNLDRNDFNRVCTCGDNVVLIINLLMLLNCVNCRKMQHETIQLEFHLTYNLYLYHFTAALKINFSRTWFTTMII